MTLSLAGPLLLVGAGKMGGAMLEGWLRQGLDPALVFIQDPALPPEAAAPLVVPCPCIRARQPWRSSWGRPSQRWRALRA